ncbi:MAG: DUF1295 domain-containing protein [Porticoccaceae bacterium]
MTTTNSIIGIILSLLVGAGILLAGSQGSVNVFGMPLFLLCGIIGFALHWIVFLPSFAFKTEHYFDLTGSLSYIGTIIAALYLNPNLDIRDLIICAMILIWAVRLGSFLFSRVKKAGQDIRFIVMKTKFFWFLMTWTLGGLWVLVTMAAGLAAMTSNATVALGPLSYLAICLWILGMAIEVIADQQKTRFRSDPENRDRFITTGLWAWSQHPNYFGEILLWLGLALLAVPVLSGWQLATLISPIFVYVLLTKISGIPLLDRLAKKKWGSDPEFVAYTEATPVLMLRRPRG